MSDQLVPPKCPTGLKPTANRMKGKGTEPVEPQQGCSSPVPIRLVTKTTEVEKKGKRRSPRTLYGCGTPDLEYPLNPHPSSYWLVGNALTHSIQVQTA